MSDRLTLTRALEGSGMQSDAAERIATEIYDAIHDNVATKTDLRELEARLGKAMSDAKFELVKWIVGIAIAQVGTVIAVLKLFPGHG
jgi:hypothetical protein